jgi:hypothetical protein
MNNFNDWHNFYEPYIQIRKILDIDTIVENYINENYSRIIEKQFDEYKNIGKYKRAGEFIDNEIKSGLKNPDSYYLELKKGNKKDITNILSNIKNLPLIEDYIEDLNYFTNREYTHAKTYLEDTLKLGKIFLNHPESCNYLLWILSTTDDDSNNFQYGSNYLETVARVIKDKAEQFNSIDDSHYKISLESYRKYININYFLTQDNVLDLYIRINYPRILKDEFKLNKANMTQDTFMREKNLYSGDDDGRFLYNSLAKKKKKLDNNLLEEFRKFEVLKRANDTTHSKEIKRLNHIRLALQMGALAFQKFPNLTIAIMTAIENAKSEVYGIPYLNELSRQLNIVAYKEWQVERDIELDYQQEKHYNDNMSSQEYDEAKLLGYDI